MLPDGDESDLERLAEEEIPESVCLELLAQHPERRIGLLQNRRLSNTVLWILAGDSDYRVRRAVAQHPALEPRLADELSRDEYPGVRLMLVCNPAIDSQTLLRMVREDPWSDLRDIGVKRLATTP